MLNIFFYKLERIHVIPLWMSLVNFIQHPFFHTGECESHITCALDIVPYGLPNFLITELFQYYNDTYKSI